MDKEPKGGMNGHEKSRDDVSHGFFWMYKRPGQSICLLNQGNMLHLFWVGTVLIGSLISVGTGQNQVVDRN